MIYILCEKAKSVQWNWDTVIFSLFLCKGSYLCFDAVMWRVGMFVNHFFPLPGMIFDFSHSYSQQFDTRLIDLDFPCRVTENDKANIAGLVSLYSV